MGQHKEEYFIVPMLKVLFYKNEPTSTEDIKKEIYRYCTLSEEDLTPYPSRSKKEPRYFQIVGNIISHNNDNFLKYVSRIKSINELTGKQNPDLFELNDDGYSFVKTIIDEDEETIDDYIVFEDLEYQPSNELAIDEPYKRIVDAYEKNGEIKKVSADKNISRIVLELSDFKCEIGRLLGNDHELFLNKNGEPYLEVHHLIPLKASKDFFPLNIDIVPNLVPLCPSCHAKLHRGSLDEKKIILRLLYDKRIALLNDNGLYISFEDLINKYYI